MFTSSLDGMLLKQYVQGAFAYGWLSAAEQPPTSGNYVSIAQAVVSPASRTSMVIPYHAEDWTNWGHLGGTITISSSSPFADPVIDPAFFSVSPLCHI